MFDIFRMAAKFNLKSGGALGGRSTNTVCSLQSVSGRGAFVVPLLFTFDVEWCGSGVTSAKLWSCIQRNIIHSSIVKVKINVSYACEMPSKQ